MSLIPFRLPRVTALLLSLVLLCGCARPDDAPPRARQGTLDLSGWNFATHGPVALNGEWQFYWRRFVSPEELHRQPDSPPPVFVSLPGSWNRLKPPGISPERKGFATFRLRLVPGSSARNLALQLGNIRSSYRLWIDGRLQVENGTIGTYERTEIPGNLIQLVPLPPGDGPFDILLQISNHHYREGGVIGPVRLGPIGILDGQQHRQWGIAIFCISVLLVMGLYHIVLFCFRRQDAAPLYFGTYCLLWSGYSLISNSSGWVVSLFTGQLPPWLPNRVDLICIVLSVPVGYSFFCTLYPDEKSPLLRKAAWILAVIFTCLGVTTSTFTFTSAMPLYYLISVGMILCSLFMLLTAARRKREGAVFILAGFLVLGCIAINDMLYALQLINSVSLIHIGMVIFALFQAIALSRRFSNAFSSVEHLSGELSAKNTALEAEICERNRLERKIVDVAEEARRRVSYELHDGLCQQLTAARLHCRALERKLTGTETTRTDLSQLSSLLEESVNQAYDLSRGLWPLEPEADSMLRSLETLTRKLSHSSGVIIQFERGGDCDECRHTDMAKLCRIAQEAITNAVKHARASRITVTLRCLEQGQVLLRVQDNGVGIAATAGTRGGLGMSIMAHRARLLGGELSIQDADGGGTLVSCVIPCHTDCPEVTADE